MADTPDENRPAARPSQTRPRPSSPSAAESGTFSEADDAVPGVAPDAAGTVPSKPKSQGRSTGNRKGKGNAKANAKAKGKKDKPALPAHKAKRRKKMKIGGGILFFLLLVWLFTRPLTGPLEVGICRTYAQLRLAYPTTFRIMTYEPFDSDRTTRLYFTFTGAFGEYRSSMIDCKFVPRAGTVPQLQSVAIDRMPEPKPRIDAFNAGMEGVIASKPDRRIPRRHDGTLIDLKRDEEF